MSGERGHGAAAAWLVLGLAVVIRSQRLLPRDKDFEAAEWKL